jgi:hypothetical protein
MQTKANSRRRAWAAPAAVAALLAAWLCVVAIALATDDSAGDSRSAGPRSTEAQTPSGRTGRAGPADLPLDP